MRPALIRIHRRVSLDAMAERLRVPVADLRTLEAMPLGVWDVRDLASYLRALDCQLELVAVDPFGARIALDANGAGQ
jgi:hypothetical protein